MNGCLLFLTSFPSGPTSAGSAAAVLEKSCEADTEHFHTGCIDVTSMTAVMDVIVQHALHKSQEAEMALSYALRNAMLTDMMPGPKM